MAIVGFTIILTVFFNIKKRLNIGNNPINSSIEVVTVPTKFYTENEIITLINDYQHTHNVKIYQWRQNKIIDAFPDKKITKAQATAIIDSVANYDYGRTR